MKIALIGAGNLATVLGHALCNARHDIVQVYSHTMTAANLLAEKLNAAPADSLDTITNDADLYIIAVRDSVLDAVIGRLCPNRTEKLFVHTAGSVPIDVFRGRARHFGVFYPMQTFSKTRIVDFRNIPVFIEADSPATIQSITEVAQSVSNNVRELCSSDRRYLHFDIMLPLTDETAKKVHELLPHEAQTGPAIRYDENIIAAQMQLMNDNPRAQQLYQLMAQSIHERSKK